MLANLQIILPVFLLVGAGYLAAKRNIFGPDQADAVMKFAQTFAIPALLFSAVARLDLSAVFQPQLLASFYAGNTFAFIVGGLIARYYFKRPPGAAVAVGFSGMFANSVLLGFPIIERAFGADALQPVYALVAIHAPYCYIVGITTMEVVRADGQPLRKTVKRILKEIFSNSLTIGLMLGFAVNLSGITLPQFVWSPIKMMVSAAIPAALFALGGIMVRYKLADRIGETTVVLILKLFVHPGIAYVLATQVFDMSIEFTRAAVMTGAMAPGINVYVFASLYDRAKGTAASAVLLGTAASILSVSFWLFVLAT
jgi:malonate transporter and related proteins